MTTKTYKVTEVTEEDQSPNKQQPVIDKHNLKKLLMSKPPDPKPLKRVSIRCDKDNRLWAVRPVGKTVKRSARLAKCILSDVKFVSQDTGETFEKEVYVGCGSYDHETMTAYSGFAQGGILPAKHPESVPDNVSKLYYDRESGEFRDVHTDEVVTECAFLILKEDCQHEYVPMPKGKKCSQ